MSNNGPRLIISEAKIAARLDQLAEQINKDYADVDELILIGVLRGTFIFLADLSRRLTIPVAVDFLAVAPYEADPNPVGAVRLIMDTRRSVLNKHVLLVDDIIDSGTTVDYLRQLLWTRNPASLKTCVLMRKGTDENLDIHIDYVGFQTPDRFLVGYGLDYQDRHRTLPYIATLDPA